MNQNTSPTLMGIVDSEIDYLLANAEFSAELRQRQTKVVVLMTQDWCPQWIEMRAFLPEFTDQAAIYCLEYNLRPDFDRIREFKEQVLGNWEVPYLRYYHLGQLIATTNYLPRNTFAALLTRDKPFSLR